MGAFKDARDDLRLLKLVTSSTGEVDEEVYKIVNCLAKKHRRVLGTLLFSSNIATKRSGKERELSLSRKSCISVSAINIACVFIENELAQAKIKYETIAAAQDDALGGDNTDDAQLVLQQVAEPMEIQQELHHDHLQQDQAQLAEELQGVQNNLEMEHVQQLGEGAGDEQEHQPPGEQPEAVNQLDPILVRFCAQFQPQEQQKVFHYLLRQHEHNTNITVHAKNGRHTHLNPLRPCRQWRHSTMLV